MTFFCVNNRQKSYADKWQRPLEFQVGDLVFLKVIPMCGVVWFSWKGKLSKRYARPFEIRSRIGDVAYRLVLPPELGGVHDVSHLSMPCKYVPDPTHLLQHKSLQLQASASYVEQPIRIIHTKETFMRTRTIQWEHYRSEEANWSLGTRSGNPIPIFFLRRYVWTFGRPNVLSRWGGCKVPNLTSVLSFLILHLA